MGRQKIKMEKIEADDKRHICFSKRRKGLFRKAMKLCNLGCEMAIVIFSTAGHAFTFGNPSVHHVFSRFLGCNIEAPRQQGLEIAEPDDEDDVVDSSEDSGDERTPAPQAQTPMELDAAAAEDSAVMPIPVIPNLDHAVLQNGNKIDERNEQEKEQRPLATEDIIEVILENDISKKLSECCLNTIIHELLSGDIHERILSMEQSAQEEEEEEEEEDKNKSLLANSNTTSKEQELQTQENNNNNNTSKDQSSSESTEYFNWGKAADDLNLDQLIKLEGLIQEHHSNVMELAEKMFEERPLSLGSWNT